MNLTTKLAAATIAGYAALQVARHIVCMNRKFDRRYERVIVTGGSRGFGLLVSRQLVDQDARLTICSRDEPDLEVAAAELRHRSGKVLVTQCDFRRREQVESLVKRVVTDFNCVIRINALNNLCPQFH